jgi:predicted Zn-dependent protease
MDPFVLRLAAIRPTHRNSTNRLYQLLYVTPKRAFRDLDGAFLASLKSFRYLEGAEASPKPAQHIRIVTVAGGDTVQTLADRMAVPEKRLEWFRVLNGLDVGDAVKVGDKVKLVE